MAEMSGTVYPLPARNAAAQHDVSFVEDDWLSGRRRPCRILELDMQSVALGTDMCESVRIAADAPDHDA